jgi:hypothetical protein
LFIENAFLLASAGQIVCPQSALSHLFRFAEPHLYGLNQLKPVQELRRTFAPCAATVSTGGDQEKRLAAFSLQAFDFFA